MAPLDLFNNNQEFSYKDKFSRWLDQIRDAKIEGVMIDVWWGLVETSEKNYKFTGYDEAFKMMKDRNLKIIPVLSFHQCGGNVGDTCDIKLPTFVRSSSARPFYKDLDGHEDQEYISLGFDTTKITSRTPVDMYDDFMQAFAKHFDSYISSGTIKTIEVGLGPAGELRYPGYQSAYWKYPGCGEFQSFDSKLSAKIKEDAKAAGHTDYGKTPTNTGGYNTQPTGSQFWSSGWSSDYGKWYLNWYQQQLIDHGERILSKARKVFPNTKISAKIAGIHWWYDNSCHCAEFTAGYYNYYDHNGYRDFGSMFKKYKINVCFTCLEMEKQSYDSDPPALVNQILDMSKWAGIEFEGENALYTPNWNSYNKIISWAKKGVSCFTWLRMCDDLMNSNWNDFKNFVNQMHSA